MREVPLSHRRCTPASRGKRFPYFRSKKKHCRHLEIRCISLGIQNPQDSVICCGHGNCCVHFAGNGAGGWELYLYVPNREYGDAWHIRTGCKLRWLRRVQRVAPSGELRRAPSLSGDRVLCLTCLSPLSVRGKSKWMSGSHAGDAHGSRGQRG